MKQEEQSEEVLRRMDEILRRMLDTKPKPRKAKKRAKKPAK